MKQVNHAEFKDQGNLAWRHFSSLQLGASLSCTMSGHCICCLYHVLHSAATYWTDPPCTIFLPVGTQRSAQSRSALQRAHVHKFHILPQPVQFAIACFEAVASLVRLACFFLTFKPVSLHSMSWNNCDTCRFEVSIRAEITQCRVTTCVTSSLSQTFCAAVTICLGSAHGLVLGFYLFFTYFCRVTLIKAGTGGTA